MNIQNHQLKDLMILNDMTNVIKEPTRITDASRTLIDPIVVSENINVWHSGVLSVPGGGGGDQ